MSNINLPEGFAPTQDWVLVHIPEVVEDTTEKKTDFGLVLINDIDEGPKGPLSAQVVSAGPGYFDQNGNRVPMDIAVGDKVYYNAHSGVAFEYEGEDYYFLNARNGSIVATIKGGN